MPQFDFASVFIPQVAWLAVLFAVLYFGVVRLTLPKLSRVMDAREDRIADDLAAARTAKDGADSVRAEYHAAMDRARDEARAAVAAAKASAAAAGEVRLAQARSAADARLAEAEAAIARSSAEAEPALRDAAAEGAQAIVARLTSHDVSLAASRAAVDARLAG